MLLLASSNEAASYSVYSSEKKTKSVRLKTCGVDCDFYIRAFRGACECTWKYRSTSSNSPAQLEIKDTINEVKYGCLLLLVEVFMKVMNGLVMTLEEDKRFLCVWLLYYVSNFADSRMKVPRYRSSPTS